MGDVNFLANISLGKIQKWSFKKNSSITPISFPGENSGETEGIDTLGIISYITFKGRWTGKYQDIQSYIAQLNAIADGNQFTPSTLQSPFVNTTTSGDVIRSGIISSNTLVASDKVTDNTVDYVALGIQINDIVKNLTTGETALVNSAVINTHVLDLDDDIFTTVGTPYAVTATMNVKILNIDTTWQLPGLSYCDYDISVIQVK